MKRRAFLALLAGGVATVQAAQKAGGPAKPSSTKGGSERAPRSGLDNAILVDGHVHIISRVFHEGIDPWKPQATGLFDFARAKQGGLNVAIHALYLEDPYNRYNYTVKHACRLLESFYRVLEANRDTMELALTAADVRRIVAQGRMAQVLGLEGGFDMEGDLDVLRFFYRAGVRMIQFVHHRTTSAFADSYEDVQKWQGINDRGREVIREMNRLGILIDISHASEAAQRQLIEASEAPVVASHVGAKHFSNHPQNLSDELLKAVAAKGGMVGIHGHGSFLGQKYWDWRKAHEKPWQTGTMSMTRPPIDHGEYLAELDAKLNDEWRNGPRMWFGKPWRETYPEGVPVPTLDDYIATVDYMVNLLGADHVGLGLDLMWGTYWLRDFDATSYPRITEALLAKGYSPKTIRKILGENWLRVLDAAKVKTSRSG